MNSHETSKFYLDEMRKIDMQQKNMSDQYNQPQNENMHRITKMMQSDHILYKPRTGQTWEQYSKELPIHVKYQNDINYKVHIENNGKKSWYTHMKPECFMCKDTDMINVLLTVIQMMAKAHPNDIY